MLSWFWITFTDTRNIHYLVAGKSVSEALDKIAIPYQDVKVSEATWRSIQKAIGCELPAGVKPEDNATGYIPFSTDATSVAIWP